MIPKLQNARNVHNVVFGESEHLVDIVYAFSTRQRNPSLKTQGGFIRASPTSTTGITTVGTPLGFPAAIQLEGSCDIQRDRRGPRLSAGNASGTDTQGGTTFEAPKYLTIGLPLRHQTDPFEQSIVSKFLFPKGSGSEAVHREPFWCLENALTHFCKRSDGFLDSRTVIFHLKMKIGQRHSLRPYKWNLTAPEEVSFHFRQATGDEIQYLGACN
jgi:hypothetical protein